MSFSDYLEDAVLDRVLGNISFSAPTQVYIALSTTTPNDDGTNFTEPSGGAYVRLSVSNDLTEWPASSGGSKSNANAQTFPTATSAWGIITHFGIYDASSGGNLLLWGLLTVPKDVNPGDLTSFGAGKLTSTLD